MSELNEVWKPIKGYEGLYEMSNLGRVKSLPKEWIVRNGGIHKTKEIILKPHLAGGRYLVVNLSKKNMCKTYLIHHLVWDHFGNSPRNGIRLQIDHLNGEKTDNRIDNLQLLTCRENISKYRKTQKTSSKFVGVCWHKGKKKWGVSIGIDGKHKHLGYFDTEEEASKQYQLALKQFNKTGKLIIKTPAEKRRSSKYKGVTWFKDRSKWKAQTTLGGKCKHLGYFDNEYDAHIAYEEAKRRIDERKHK